MNQSVLEYKYQPPIKLANTTIYCLEKDLIGFKLYCFQKTLTVLCQIHSWKSNTLIFNEINLNFRCLTAELIVV